MKKRQYWIHEADPQFWKWSALSAAYLAELVIGAILAAVGGTARYIGMGMLTALGATIGRFFIPLLFAWLV
ncbi:hypothetical protein ABZ413_16545 [Nocardia rhamnosiphila]|uniref:hypothetical protein n=1 Tax=Nocardia rhamnosiphila TaxID=426716 RepID=UPI0033C42C99